MPLTLLDPELKIAFLYLCRIQMEVTNGSAGNKTTAPKEILFLSFSLLKNLTNTTLLKKKKKKEEWVTKRKEEWVVESSTFSNYIFSHFIVLHELEQSTTSKPDLIFQGLRFFTCILKSLSTSLRCFRGWWIQIYFPLRCSF